MAEPVFHGGVIGICSAPASPSAQHECPCVSHGPEETGKVKMLRFSLVGMAAAALVACASSTPQRRIAANPQMVQSLSQNDLAAVQSGRIAEGMSRDAVYLALGAPNNVMKGSRAGKETEMWRYTSLQPVVSNSFFLGAGAGYFGPHGNRFWGPGFGPGMMTTGTDFIPVTSAVIQFENAKVIGWERAQ